MPRCAGLPTRVTRTSSTSRAARRPSGLGSPYSRRVPAVPCARFCPWFTVRCRRPAPRRVPVVPCAILCLFFVVRRRPAVQPAHAKRLPPLPLPLPLPHNSAATNPRNAGRLIARYLSLVHRSLPPQPAHARRPPPLPLPLPLPHNSAAINPRRTGGGSFHHRRQAFLRRDI